MYVCVPYCDFIDEVLNSLLTPINATRLFQFLAVKKYLHKIFTFQPHVCHANANWKFFTLNFFKSIGNDSKRFYVNKFTYWMAVHTGEYFSFIARLSITLMWFKTVWSGWLLADYEQFFSGKFILKKWNF